jgi:hypothetical protein
MEQFEHISLLGLHLHEYSYTFSVNRSFSRSVANFQSSVTLSQTIYSETVTFSKDFFSLNHCQILPIILGEVVCYQGWTGHMSNATLVAGAFAFSHTKCQKEPFGDIMGAFWSQRPFDPSPPLFVVYLLYQL